MCLYIQESDANSSLGSIECEPRSSKPLVVLMSIKLLLLPDISSGSAYFKSNLQPGMPRLRVSDVHLASPAKNSTQE